MNKHDLWLRALLLAWILALAWFFCGCCASPDLAPAWSAHAIRVVWAGAYRQSSEPPIVEWRAECLGPDGLPGVRLPNAYEGIAAGACVLSWYDPLYDFAVVAPRGPAHATGLAWELRNAVDCRPRPQTCLDVPETPGAVAAVKAALEALKAAGL